VSELNVPFDLMEWIEDHAADFEPPVSNKVVWSDRDLVFMIVGGPNARNDFHIDPYDEIFMQLRGDIRVDLIDHDDIRHERRVAQGEVMLVPAETPHSPRRPAGSWGLVIERPRPPGVLDELAWFCDDCGLELHRSSFHVSDIETELAAAIGRFNRDESLRTCKRCESLQAVPEDFVL